LIKIESIQDTVRAKNWKALLQQHRWSWNFIPTACLFYVSCVFMAGMYLSFQLSIKIIQYSLLLRIFCS